MQFRLQTAVVALLLAPCITAAPQTTTEWLRSEAGGDWTSITTDPFVRQLAAGTLDNSTRRQVSGAGS